MTVNEIVDQLRAARPAASDALRLQVMTVASAPPAAAPSSRDRFRIPRRPALFVPAAAAGLAVVSAVAIGISRPDTTAREAAIPPATVQRSTTPSGAEAFSGPSADASATESQKARAGAGHRPRTALQRQSDPCRRGHGRALRGDPAGARDRPRPGRATWSRSSTRPARTGRRHSRSGSRRPARATPSPGSRISGRSWVRASRSRTSRNRWTGSTGSSSGCARRSRH